MEGPEPMERGRNFRLLADEELPKLLEFLTEHLPESLKVNLKKKKLNKTELKNQLIHLFSVNF